MEEVESPSGKESSPALARGSKSLDGRMGVVVAVDGMMTIIALLTIIEFLCSLGSKQQLDCQL